MKRINNITLCCIDCNTYGAAVSALNKSLEQIIPNRTIFLTDIDIKIDGVEVIQIPTISSKSEYSYFCVKELYKYFDTDFILLVQNDGWVINGESWDNDFLNFDFIGAPWLYQDGRNVGNGGVSIRSMKLQKILGMDDFIKVIDPEDEIIGRLYRRYLEGKHGIKFPEESLADKFSFELRQPVCQTFAFHSYFHAPFRKHIILKRTAAMGDVILLEPVMEYFHNQGYQVVLDTLPQFFNLFSEHYFPVIHISQMNKNIVPERVISFDMAYEVFPKQLVLQSYYDVAGIKDGIIRNSKLNINRGGEEKFFKKYAVIHIDSTGIPHRDISGINWEVVVKYLESKGFAVFQIGKRVKDEVATYFNTITIELLMYFIKKCDLFIGIDSGNLQIAQALGVKSIGFFGSVNPKYRYANFDKLIPLHTPCISEEHEFCYHNTSGSVVGTDCFYNKELPPCTQFKTETVIKAIDKSI